MGRFPYVEMRRKSLASPLLKGFQLGVLIVLALVILLPLLWLVSTSLKGPAEEIFTSPPALLPVEPSLMAYWRLFADNPLGIYLLNSTVVSCLAVVANLLFCSLAAYPLARMRFAGRGLVLALVVATILIPFQVVMIPLYLLMVQLGLRNSLMALVIPQAATAFGLYLLRQSFLTVPVELEEAARIDGCSRLGEWWNVMIPAARADLITLAMFVFIGTWSDFLWPLVILDDPSLYTLPLGLQQLASSFSLDWRIVAAGSVVSILPVLALFILLQRFILPSASGDAVKG
ncbi:L-arabinose transport system permease protein AraQ [Prochlorococcus marinus str. MIT 1342]|uniref:carbohydrate ABC transporter permease n=1 Tax=Prochlorococcus TaxID=1218 RepID=UPI0007B38190|nr:carbohydrate ABC transporter permease [Prochlorococcus marinus]KZR83726.1 L-arabinose transport system permease protein AraQ [Prochlorococcus marinus str. MIT 1342]